MRHIENMSLSVHKMNIETGYDSWYIRLHDLNYFFYRYKIKISSGAMIKHMHFKKLFLSRTELSLFVLWLKYENSQNYYIFYIN